MKKLLTIFTLFSLLQSCTKEVDVSQGEASGEGVEFTASVVNVGETRAELINSWLGDEQVALFASGYDKVYHFAVAADGSMSGDEIIVDRETEMTYTAFYPYDADLSTIEEYEAACTEGNVDYMKATTKATGKAVNLQFEHQLAALSFTIMIEGVATDPAITLFLDGGNSIALDVDVSICSVASMLKANYFVADGTDLSSALIKIEQSGTTILHTIKREDSNILEIGKQYPYSCTIGSLPIGAGTAEDPYIIYTADDMRKVGTGTDGWNLDSHYILAWDIDLGGEVFTAIGRDVDGKFGNGSFQGSFQGSFDGDGHKISGLYTNKLSSEQQGLFGFIYNATIKNLGVCGSVLGASYTGCVAGVSVNSSISYCYNECSIVYYNHNTSDYGGIVGMSVNSSISYCYNKGLINALNDAGGIVGSCENSSVSYCYNEGLINARAQVGGIVGVCDNTQVSNCYNEGSIKARENTGGIVGRIRNGISVSYCYNKCSSIIMNDIEYINTSGAVVGTNTGNVVSYCYYDKELLTGDMTGAVQGEDDGTNYCGLMTAMMKGAAESEGSMLYYFTQGGSTAWEADSENINEGYPILKWQTAND